MENTNMKNTNMKNIPDDELIDYLDKGLKSLSINLSFDEENRKVYSNGNLLNLTWTDLDCTKPWYGLDMHTEKAFEMADQIIEELNLDEDLDKHFVLYAINKDIEFQWDDIEKRRKLFPSPGGR